MEKLSYLHHKNVWGNSITNKLSWLRWIFLPNTAADENQQAEDSGRTAGESDRNAADGDRNAAESDQQGNKKPTYRDFFLAMAFLANARSKDKKYQVLHYTLLGAYTLCSLGELY